MPPQAAAVRAAPSLLSRLAPESSLLSSFVRDVHLRTALVLGPDKQPAKNKNPGCCGHSVQVPLATNTKPWQSLPGPERKHSIVTTQRRAPRCTPSPEARVGRGQSTAGTHTAPPRRPSPGREASTGRSGPLRVLPAPSQTRVAQRERGVQRLLHALRRSLPSVVLALLPPQPAPLSRGHCWAPATARPFPCSPPVPTFAGALLPLTRPGTSRPGSRRCLGLARLGSSVRRGARTSLKGRSWPSKSGRSTSRRSSVLKSLRATKLEDYGPERGTGCGLGNVR